MLVFIIHNESASPVGKVADAELHFDSTDGVLAGTKLIGFSIWERAHKPGDLNVTFPSRQYVVNGERRSFSLLRPIEDGSATERLRALIVETYRNHPTTKRERP